MSIAAETKTQVAEIGDKYKYGFVTDIEMEMAPKGLSEDTVRYISAKKGEPEWMLEWRLAAFKRWGAMKEPNWARVHYPKIDNQNSYQGGMIKAFAIAIPTLTAGAATIATVAWHFLSSWGDAVNFFMRTHA